MTVTSRDNAAVKRVRRLLSDAHARRETGLFVLEGARLCAEVGASDVTVVEAFISPDAEARYPKQVKAVRDRAETVYEISNALAAQIGDTQNPQGLFCVCRRLPDKLSGGMLPLDGRYLALEAVRDPGNMGTILRTAEAFDLSGILLSDDCVALDNPKVLRGSMGGALRLPTGRVEDLSETIRLLRLQGFSVYACVADSEATPITDVKLGDGCICVIGNEANGLTDEVQAACTGRVTIPMRGRAESLNAAVAACLTMWELQK